VRLRTVWGCLNKLLAIRTCLPMGAMARRARKSCSPMVLHYLEKKAASARQDFNLKKNSSGAELNFRLGPGLGTLGRI